MRSKIIIIGAGTFGTAIANELAKNDANNVKLFSKDEHRVNEIVNFRKNSKYYPDIELNIALGATSNNDDIENAEIVFVALPSSVVVDFFDEFHLLFSETTLIVLLSKGFAPTGSTFIDVLNEKYGIHNTATLKGGSFAREIIFGNKTLLTLGYKNKNQCEVIKDAFLKTAIHLDYTTDIKGVEVLSALKNVYAILIGYVDARYNSANTRFMFYTLAIKEIRILLKILGGKEVSLYLSCGIGDIGLTALNDLSRNRTLGLIIGKGFFDGSYMNNSVLIEGLRSLNAIVDQIPENLFGRLPLIRKLHDFFNQKTLDLAGELEVNQHEKMKTVLTYGTFDLMHFGHIELLKRAKDLGDRLIVGLSSDEFNDIKGKQSVQSFDKRKELLLAIDYVDEVIAENNWEQKTNDVKVYDVDIFVIGDDWKGKFDFLKELCEVIYLERTHGISTTQIKKVYNK